MALITASYRDQEFVRVGYYVNNEYEDPELRENPPAEPQFDKLIRTIASDQPRVTKFKINWDSTAAAAAAAAAAGTLATTSSQADANDMAANTNTQDSEMVDISNISAKNTDSFGSNDISKPAVNGNLENNKENINENLSQKLVISEARS